MTEKYNTLIYPHTMTKMFVDRDQLTKMFVDRDQLAKRGRGSCLRDGKASTRPHLYPGAVQSMRPGFPSFQNFDKYPP